MWAIGEERWTRKWPCSGHYLHGFVFILTVTQIIDEEKELTVF